MPFVKNSISYSQVSSLGQVKRAANCLGELYHHLSDFNAENLSTTLPNFHNGKSIIKKFEEALLNGSQQKLLFAENLISEIEKKITLLKKWDEVCITLPIRVVHYDTKINNFLSGRTCCLLTVGISAPVETIKI